MSSIFFCMVELWFGEGCIVYGVIVFYGEVIIVCDFDGEFWEMFVFGVFWCFIVECGYKVKLLVFYDV